MATTFNEMTIHEEKTGHFKLHEGKDTEGNHENTFYHHCLLFRRGEVKDPSSMQILSIQ